LRSADVLTSPGSRWLLACLDAVGRRRPPPPPPDDVSRTGASWDTLLAHADAEDLLPALAYAASAAGWAAMPSPARRRLTDGLATARARHLLMTRALASILRHCAASDLAVIVLKGPVLAETVYPDPALRPFTDLDLLVRPEDRRRADVALRAIGYQPLADEHTWDFDVGFDGATVYESAAGVRVDLHWALLTEARYAWRARAAGTVWDRAVPLTLGGERALGLAPEDLVLHLALHFAVHHSLTGVLRQWDLALVLAHTPIKWSRVVRRAGAWRVRSALFFTLLSLSASFPAAVPPRVLRRLRRRGLRAALLTNVLLGANADRRRRLEHVVTLLIIDRARDVVGSVGRTLWPSAAWLRARYGRESAGLGRLYVAHLRRMAGVLASTGWRA
jgi:hypothetical protein